MKPSKKNAKKRKKRPAPATPAAPTAADPCPPSETLTLAASETESSGSSCEASSTSAFTASSSGTASTSSFSASASTASAGDDRRDLAWLLDAFASATIDQVDSAYRGAGGDAFLAAGILGATLDAQPPPPPPPPDHGSAGRKPFRKPKKVACAASGMVADVIGKDYTRPAPSPVSEGNPWKGKGALSASNECKVGAVWNYSVEDAEQFLCSMLGDNSELGMGVVRDVLGQSGNDVEKARAGVEMALIDVVANSIRLPLRRLFGGVSDSVTTNITIPIVARNEAAELAAKYQGQGFQSLKLKVGKNLNSDIEVLKAIIRLVHPAHLS